MSKKYFYIAKGAEDKHPWLYYGENPPMIKDNKTFCDTNCILIGSFCDNPIADSIKDGEIIKIYIRKENKKK